jgi:metal-sulfur cluster biosynthetic enzyme
MLMTEVPEARRPGPKAVTDCLDQIVDPCSTASVTPMSIVEVGLLRGVDISADGGSRSICG